MRAVRREAGKRGGTQRQKWTPFCTRRPHARGSQKFFTREHKSYLDKQLRSHSALAPRREPVRQKNSSNITRVCVLAAHLTCVVEDVRVHALGQARVRLGFDLRREMDAPKPAPRSQKTTTPPPSANKPPRKARNEQQQERQMSTRSERASAYLVKTQARRHESVYDSNGFRLRRLCMWVTVMSSSAVLKLGNAETPALRRRTEGEKKGDLAGPRPSPGFTQDGGDLAHSVW